jgi:hypothetical protein
MSLPASKCVLLNETHTPHSCRPANVETCLRLSIRLVLLVWTLNPAVQEAQVPPVGGPEVPELSLFDFMMQDCMAEHGIDIALVFDERRSASPSHLDALRIAIDHLFDDGLITRWPPIDRIVVSQVDRP